MRFAKLINSLPDRRSLAAFTLRLALGLVFLYAGYVKLRQPWYVFAGMIDNYGVVAPSVSEVIARVLPPLEVVLGVALLAGLYRKISSAAAVVFLVPFFGLMLWAYARGMEIDCGCFGSGQTLGPRTLFRDGVLVAAAIWLAFLSWRSSAPQARLDASSPG
ncbi:MAG: DoxX family membrane protein [Bryobacterales bacterium]|nr:DoxX family membrane protein [Bryobacterales bacterium]